MCYAVLLCAVLCAIVLLGTVLDCTYMCCAVLCCAALCCTSSVQLGWHALPLKGACMQASDKAEAGPAADDTSADPIRFGPKPDNLIPKLPQDTEAAEGQVYRPPKLNPVSMENDPDKDYGKKERRKQQHAARKAGRSEFVQALAAELEGAPEEASSYCSCMSCL